MRRPLAKRLGAASQRPRRGAHAHGGLAEPLFERVGAMEAVREALFERVGSALQFGQPFGEPIGAVAQLFEAVLQPGGAAGKSLGAVFEARPPRFEALEGAVELDRDVARRPDLVALGGEDLGEEPLLLGHSPQRGVLAGRRFEFAGEAPGTPQGLAAEAGKERLEFEFQGKAGARRAFADRRRAARSRPRVVRGLRSPVPRRRRPVRARRRARRRRRRPVRSPRRAIRCRSRRARGPPAAPRPPPRRAGGWGRARRAARGRRGPRTRVARRARAAARRLLDRRRADHRAHAGALDEAALRALQQGEPVRRRDRPPPGRDDDLEWGLPPRADRAVDRFGAAAGLA